MKNLNNLVDLLDKAISDLEKLKNTNFDAIYEAFEEGRISGYNEAMADVKGENFFGIKDGEQYIKNRYERTI